jgi:hypothetical protein
MKFIQSSGAKGSFLLQDAKKISLEYFYTYVTNATATFFPATNSLQSFVGYYAEKLTGDTTLAETFKQFEEVYLKIENGTFKFCWSKPEPQHLYDIYPDELQLLDVPRLCDIDIFDFKRKHESMVLWDDETIIVGQINEAAVYLSPLLYMEDLPYGITRWDQLAVFIAMSKVFPDRESKEIFELYKKVSATPFPTKEYEVIRRSGQNV